MNEGRVKITRLYLQHLPRYTTHCILKFAFLKRAPILLFLAWVFSCLEIQKNFDTLYNKNSRFLNATILSNLMCCIVVCRVPVLLFTSHWVKSFKSFQKSVVFINQTRGKKNDILMPNLDELPFDLSVYMTWKRLENFGIQK